MRPGVGAVERLETGGGRRFQVIEDFRYETATAQLAPGETVLLVTDGVTEGVDRRGDLFGTPRVTALAASAARTPAHSEPARLVADPVTALRTFREPVEPADDVTLLAVQWLGPDRPPSPRTARSPHRDLDAPVAGLGYAVGRRHPGSRFPRPTAVMRAGSIPGRSGGHGSARPGEARGRRCMARADGVGVAGHGELRAGRVAIAASTCSTKAWDSGVNCSVASTK